MKKKKPELLAPAGDLLKLKTALAFGADAIYFGLPDFSLRARINHFSWPQIKEAIDICHQKKKKAYVTVNILAHNYHLNNLKSHILKLKKLKPDALIISDPGVLQIAKKEWPKVEIILSTQANASNSQSVKFWQKQGIKRVILSRDLNIKEIKEIIKDNPRVEIETFIHGALCLAYSGRCFLSQYFLSRNANLGDCVQPCRWEYEIKPINKKESLIVGEDKNGTYLLNSLDMCLIKRIEEMINLGISAFKIEGRAKSVYYLANVVGAYRQAIDVYYSKIKKSEKKKKINFLYKELETKLVHRGFSEGLMFGNKKENKQNFKDSKSLPNWEFCGQVVDCMKIKKNKYAVIFKVHNSLKINDNLELISPPYELRKWQLKKIYDLNEQEINEAHGGGGGQKVIIYFKHVVPIYSVLRRRF
jgi:U32 family peptidase